MKIGFLTTIFPMKEQYIYDFFDSIKNQTYKNFDVIVVNDGYEKFEELKSIYNQYLNIIELEYSNTPAKNREHGINYCIEKAYDILIFGDSDDYFVQNRVEKSIELLQNNDIVVNDFDLFDENGIYEEKYISNRVENNAIIKASFIEDKNIFGLSNSALNLNILKNRVIFEKDIVAVDWFLFKNLLRNGKKAIFTNETISFYRQHKENIVGLQKKDNIYYLWWEKR